jgi:hypothetical protein
MGIKPASSSLDDSIIRKRYREKKGTIAILDFLGISNLGKSETLDYLRRRDEVLSELDEIRKTGTWLIPKFKTEIIPEYYTFGDTLMITWEKDKNLNIYYTLRLMGSLLIDLFIICINKGLLLRGSISFGEYIENRTKQRFCVVGNAVSDGAAWYDKANWFGIIATPRTGNILDTYKLICEEQGNDNKMVSFNHIFIKYNIPLKTNESKMWALSWPIGYVLQKKSMNGMSRLSLLRAFEDIEIIPYGTEDKYYNSKMFVDYCIDVADKIKDK